MSQDKIVVDDRNSLSGFLEDEIGTPLRGTRSRKRPADVISFAVEVEGERKGLALGFGGFGDHGSANGYGRPIFIEYREGKLTLRVWADINQEDPTHTIDLSGALESNRKEG